MSDQAPPSPPFPRPCKRCGLTIDMCESPAGKPIPTQKIRTVYRRVGKALVKLELEGELEISHFEGCPHASEFSRKKG